MTNTDKLLHSKFGGKKIALLGLGIENYYLARYILSRKVPCALTVIDNRPPEELGDKFVYLDKRGAHWLIGTDKHGNLDGFDILFRSPGWPLRDPEIAKAAKLGVDLSSPMKLFFELSPSKNIIGVTGTKGKGTVSSLIAHILRAAGKRVWLGGNIGVAPFTFFSKLTPKDFVVLEMSSFQLEDLDQSPRIAVITNFSPEHLAPADPNNPNYHRNLREYKEAKLNIIRHQKRGDIAIINDKIKTILPAKERKRSGRKSIYFKKAGYKSRLIGEHNKENIAAAALAAGCVGVSDKTIARAVNSFHGLPHRIERVGTIGGAVYYNDSFATTPEASITALKSFAGSVVLLAGGAEKNSVFSEMAMEIKKRAKLAVLFRGEATPRLKAALLKAGYPRTRIKSAASMQEAVRTAAAAVRKGDIVLLSPGCASFGLFKNYKQRGLEFMREVKSLK